MVCFYYFFVYFAVSLMDLISKHTFLVLPVFINNEDSLIDDIYCKNQYCFQEF